MKISLKLHEQTQTQTPILFKAKVPIAVFGLPFLSGVSATHHHPTSDTLSLSLRTHFTSGPSLKLSYNTPINDTTSAAAGAATAPFTLTLKSGISLSGSPNNSPLIISANFSFSPQNPNPNPSFCIQFKPRLGSFSLRKSISSTVTNASKKVDGGANLFSTNNSYGFVPLDRANIWKKLTVESGAKGSILSGVLVVADTELPVTKQVKVNLRWGVGVQSEYEKQLPYLRVNKIKVERVDDVKEDNVDRKQGNAVESAEFEMLKGMHSWMSRELSDLRKENREMRHTLEEIKSNRNRFNGGGGGKRVVVENSGGFEQWRMKKNGEANVKETKSCGSTDVESELQKAIKAASA